MKKPVPYFSMKRPSEIKRTLHSVALLLATWLGQTMLARADNTLELAQFKDPPGEFRGIHWQGFGLNRLTDDGVRASVRSAASNGAWGSFELGLSAGGATTGLSEAYLRGSKRSVDQSGRRLPQ